MPPPPLASRRRPTACFTPPGSRGRQLDHLRIWCIPSADDAPSANNSGSVHCNGAPQPGVELRCELNCNRNSDYCGLLTSFDWNDDDPHRIDTSSIDTTCTIWDVEREAVDTQLIAHDKEAA